MDIWYLSGSDLGHKTFMQHQEWPWPAAFSGLKPSSVPRTNFPLQKRNQVRTDIPNPQVKGDPTHLLILNEEEGWGGSGPDLGGLCSRQSAGINCRAEQGWLNEALGKGKRKPGGRDPQTVCHSVGGNCLNPRELLDQSSQIPSLDY